MMTGEFTLICYLIFAVLGILRMRQFGKNLPDLLTFVGHTTIFFWLLFLFMFLSSDQYVARGLHTSNESWMSWPCLLLSGLLIPIMIRDMVRGGPSERIRITPEEREAAIQAVRGQYPRAVVELIICASWLIFLGGGILATFNPTSGS